LLVLLPSAPMKASLREEGGLPTSGGSGPLYAQKLIVGLEEEKEEFVSKYITETAQFYFITGFFE
jgi:hypothetical protein